MSQELSPLDYSQLLDAVRGGAAAFRYRVRLQPAGGPGDKVFPPTFATPESAESKYAFESRRIDGQTVRCVLLDSVASQANRMELALRRAWDRGLLELPLVGVDFESLDPRWQELSDLGFITVLEAPHRIADAILRDSYYQDDGSALVPFRLSEPGVALTEARANDVTPLFHWSPTALVFGVWDSTGPRGGLGVKFPRALVSEIVGVGVEPGVKSASRIDPLGIEIKAATLYESKDDPNEWVLDPDQAAKEKGKPKKFGKTKKESGKPSAVNHGNVAPTLDEKAGGVTFDYALQTTVLSLTALRRLGFTHDTRGRLIPREQRADAEDAGHAVLAALGLLAVALGRDEGYYLRSRCHLVPEEDGALELVGRDGRVAGRFALDSRAALGVLDQALERAARHGLDWHDEVVKLQPAEKLLELVKKSHELIAREGTSED